MDGSGDGPEQNGDLPADKADEVGNDDAAPSDRDEKRGADEKAEGAEGQEVEGDVATCPQAEAESQTILESSPPGQQSSGAHRDKPDDHTNGARSAGPAMSTPRTEDDGPPEWEGMEIPEEWIPCPILVVKNLPSEASEDDLRAALEGAGVPVRSISLTDSEKNTQRVAYVRLTPPPLPWLAAQTPEPEVDGTGDTRSQEVDTGENSRQNKAQDQGVKEEHDEEMPEAEEDKQETAEQRASTSGEKADKSSCEATEEAEEPKAEKKAGGPGTKGLEMQVDDGQKKGDIVQVARFFSRKIAKEPIGLEGQQLTVEAPEPRVTIFLGNLPSEWETDTLLREYMEQYGELQRCFIMRNKDGESKDYAFVEFSLPNAAANCKEILDRRASETFERLFAIKTRSTHDGDARGNAWSRTGSDAGTKSNVPKETAPSKPEGEATSLKPEQEKQDPEDDIKDEGAPVDAPVEVPSGGKEDEQQEMGEAEEKEAEPKEEGTTGIYEEAGEAANQVSGSIRQPVEEEQKQEKSADPAPREEAHTTVAAAPRVRGELREKILRPEWSTNRTVASMFGRTLYVANLPLQEDDSKLKRIFGGHGQVLSCNFGKTKITGYGKGFGFIEFGRSDHADAAFRALDRTKHPELGCLLITFVNPSKSDSDHRSRQPNRKWAQQNPRMGYGRSGSGGGRGSGPTSRYNIQSPRGGRGMSNPSYYGSQMNAGYYGMGGRVQPASAAAAGRGPPDLAMAIAQQHIAAAQAQQQLQLQQIKMLYQRQNAQMQATYQSQILQARRQTQQAMEALDMEKKSAQQALAVAQQQVAASKTTQQPVVPHRTAQQTGAQAQGSVQQRSSGTYRGSSLGAGQQSRTARQQGTAYPSQGYSYSAQQNSQQQHGHQHQGTPQQPQPQAQAQQQQQQAQQTGYGQQGYYQAAYTQPSSYGQQTYQTSYASAQQGYATQTGTGYGSQTAYQSGYGSAQQQQQQQQPAAAAAAICNHVWANSDRVW